MDMWNMLGISPTQALQSACKAAVRYAKSAASETNAEIPAKPEVRPQTAPEKEAEPEKKAEGEKKSGLQRESEMFDYAGIDAFARQICNISGWKRKTILYFAQHLKTFHNTEDLPQDGIWETDLPAFRRLMRRFPPRKTMQEEYLTDASRALSEQIRVVFARQGRELYGDNEKDITDYIQVWLTYGERYDRKIRERFGCSYQEAVSRIYNMERRRSPLRLKKETKRHILSVRFSRQKPHGESGGDQKGRV